MKNLLRNRNGTTRTITLLLIMLFLFTGLTLVTFVETDGFRIISGAAGFGGKQLARAAKAAGNQVAVQVAAGQAALAQVGGCTPACNENQVCRNNQCVAVRLIAHYDFTNQMTDASNNQNDGTIVGTPARGGTLTDPTFADGGMALPLAGTTAALAYRNPLRLAPRDEITALFWAKGAPQQEKEMTLFSYATGASPRESSILDFRFLRTVVDQARQKTYQRAQLYIKPNILQFHLPPLNPGWNHFAVSWISGSGATRVLVNGQELPVTALGESTSDMCFDGRDNDNDRDVDCVDFDCRDQRNRRPITIRREDFRRQTREIQYTPVCGVESDAALKEYTCVDGIDNDGDGLIDCLDDSCFSRDAEGKDKSICRRLGKFLSRAQQPGPGSKMPGVACLNGECDRTAADERMRCSNRICVLDVITTEQGAAPAAEPAPSFTLSAGGVLNPDGALMLGHEQTHRFAGYSAAAAFNGMLDDVRIYDKLLSTPAITSIYQAGRRDPPCTSDANCPATHFCLTPPPGTCQPKREIGRSCTNAVQCQSGNCVDTLCVAARQPICSNMDSVQGNVQNQALLKSYAQLGDQRQDDACSSDPAKAATVVDERICTNNQLSSTEVNCADQNKVCRDGACVTDAPVPVAAGGACNANADCRVGLLCVSRICQTQSCADTDPNNDPALPGVITLDNSVSDDGVVRDECTEDAHGVVQFSCNPAGGVSDSDVNCPQGTTCQLNNNGAAACRGGDGGQQHDEAGEDEAGTSPWFARRSDEDLFMRR